MTRTRRALVAALVLAGAVGLAGCSGTVTLEAAPNADDPLCAEVTVRLPSTVDGEQRRWTDAQATGAWGTPTAVLLTCGVEPPGPSTLRCITVGGVDWLVDESESPRFRLTTYGRSPAVQLYVDNELVSPNNVLDDVRTAVSQLPKTAECTAPEAPLDEQDSATG
ncbi:DUF3515 family protein [Microbacterium sp. BK668]|uniref:DUF3515 family protein n=1 Tax=Microbacterium sp. BK668 TaxID=2512118 RepID=UPI00105E1C8B|nr:DUF3515 family protein [Microbacterium sp. BK668]TDN92656.1 uncharacterized protein DUF3515 [Microbacterium sp. BK668]